MKKDLYCIKNELPNNSTSKNLIVKIDLLSGFYNSLNHRWSKL